MIQKSRWLYPGLIAFSIILNSCSKPLEWPESPLYVFDTGKLNTIYPADKESAMSHIVGHYAHFDVVAYEDTTTRTTMRTFIISYGFTNFYLEDGKLMQSDRFVHAEQKLSRKNARSALRDEAVQAIKPRVQEVDLSLKDGVWNIYRPESPSLLGIEGDPQKSLSTDPNDPNLTDPDKDGHPGVTVQISVGKFFSGEIYITRREVFRNYLSLNYNGTLTGYVVDHSEQFVVGASKKILNQKSNNSQHPDKGLNPVLLVKVDPDIDTYEELLQVRDKIFPKEPEFKTK
ncbi:MAG TPA: hypothetical protein PLL94_12470 [Bacteroidales bacterium]|jgi:hypothetical protein|nr:MAG: hypothetical protein BWX96_02743 [Bacteroidetes bacterium ADurb.Bin145]HOU29944.1 hypothetical protein [Bacteroidales bacterium]HQK68947.1 hypothetical protein [Bacteroidales bacterium]